MIMKERSPSKQIEGFEALLRRVPKTHGNFYRTSTIPPQQAKAAKLSLTDL